MPLQQTTGNVTTDAYGGGVAAVPNYIEDVFSTYLYTGNGSTQTITNGIDLSTKGGLVWMKNRTTGGASAGLHVLTDTVTGATKQLCSNNTDPQYTYAGYGLTNFGTTGFTVTDVSGGGYYVNGTSQNYASWTFRKQPKFFDVVTWTGDGTARNISHNLGSVPGCVIIKRTDTTSNWMVSHRGSVDTWGILNGTNAFTSSAAAGTIGANGYCYLSGSTDTYFRVVAGATGYAAVNATGGTYVAYLFAHNAGGFGLTGTDNVISCGSFTTDVSGQIADVNLGYEPQWLMLKNASAVENWLMFDNMRGIPTGTADARLIPNLTNAEALTANNIELTSTGFKTGGAGLAGSATYIYIAIRRGPMKVPTSGTSVFEPVTSTSANFIKGTLEASDMGWFKDRATVANWFVGDRLRGIMSYYNPTLYTNLTNAESTPTTGDTVTSTSSEGTGNGKIYFGGAGATTDQPLGYSFRRAPSFFDEVCYTGTGGTGSRSLSHNLQAVPELIILKSRSGAASWQTGSMFTSTTVTRAVLNANNNQDLNSLYSGQSIWGGQPTSSTFLIDAAGAFNTSAATYVAYLFATCAGVSKVGSYTGNGSTQTINCGFTGGARFVLIKRTDSTGDWYVYDTARGMTTLTDPYLLLNSTAAESATLGSVTTVSTGFAVNASILAAINTNAASYIFLAIA